MGTPAAQRKAAERINRQVAPWRYRAELEHAVGVAVSQGFQFIEHDRHVSRHRPAAALALIRRSDGRAIPP